MGRTKRRRSRKKVRNFCMCDAEPDLILFNSWLHKSEVRCNKKLTMAIFNDTGRGVLTKKHIRPGEELISLPLNCTINVTTLLMDKQFCSIFLNNEKQCLTQYKHSVSFQSLLAFYLSYLKIIDDDTKWCIYLNNLPKEYTVPYFLPSDVKCDLDSDILNVISNQKYVIDRSFCIFEEVLKTIAGNDNLVIKLKKKFSKSLYEWAYFTVNTRCVYVDLSKIIDLKNVEHTILNLISDNTNISLCPYLDMINHSPCARNETKLLVKGIENLNIGSLKEDLFLDVLFTIYTKNNFDPYTQVFICYGDSHNLKLITEYGFYLPNNELDFVSFPFESVELFLKSNSIKVSLEQINFIRSHSIDKDLYIDLKGLSYNFYGLLMVIKYFYEKNMDMSRLIYSAAICSSDTNLNEIIMPMVVDKVNAIRESLRKLKCYDNECVILNNCIDLMSQYISILEKFIKLV